MESKHLQEGKGKIGVAEKPVANYPDSVEDYEQKLVGSVAAGDNKAWEELHQRYWKKLVTKFKQDVYAIYGVADLDEAQNLAQETLVRVREAAKRFKKGSKVSTWIYGIAENVFHEFTREFTRKPAWAFLPRQSSTNVNEQEDAEERVQDPKPYPGAAAVEKKRLEFIHLRLQEAIAKLEKDRPILFGAYYLHCVRGLSLEETSEILHIPQNTVKSRVHRASRFLSRVVDEWGVPHPFPQP
ncbi:MAG: hypothetical protein DRI26_02130 [Chloroflexi bacterium]|nr:MAG: hypothetical protein DRI26_02130 [Chloroflexota bacterium]